MAQKVVPASVRRTVEGYRDTGYSFESAISDLIDNSIEAGATRISVSADLDINNEALVHVADNGCGMNLAELENAMRYGSDEVAERHRLGRFGLGLKTASTTFCRRLTVITRPEGSSGALLAATWDLDVVEEADQWILEIGEATPAENDLFLEAMEVVSPGSECPTGTVVAWRKVDRLLLKRTGGPYSDPEAALKRRVERLVGTMGRPRPYPGHLSMVFQRFLDPDDDRARTVEIVVNGDVVQPWDPFCVAFGMKPKATKDWPVENEVTGEVELIAVRDFILPKPNEVEQSEAFRAAAVTSGNERQGLFIYREGRLIDQPGWFGMFANETHQRSHRIEVSFPATLDDFFGVGVRKEGLDLDAGLRDALQGWLVPRRREANELDRAGANRDEVARRSGGNPSDRTIGSQRDGLDAAEVSGRSDGSVDLRNNRTDDDESIQVLGPGGAPNARFRLVVSPSEDELFVVAQEGLTDGVLWEPGLRTGGEGDTQVRVNVSHDWYRKAYLPNSNNSSLCQAIDFLLFALAAAELNNTDEDLYEVFQEFRVEVSRNLRRLVTDLPEPDDD